MKRTLTVMSLLVILVCGIFAGRYAYDNIPVTYDGREVNVVDLYNNPTVYDESNPDGVADVIVSTNLEQTKAQNNVAAVVFDYRGFDTIGESFILLCAISGAHVILHRSKKKEAEE